MGSIKKKSVEEVSPCLTSHGVGEKRVLVSGSDTATGITQIAVTRLKEGEVAERHAHPTMEEFFLIRRGTVEITSDSEILVCKADDFVQIPAGVSHSLRAVTDAEVLTIGCATDV